MPGKNSASAVKAVSRIPARVPRNMCGESAPHSSPSPSRLGPHDDDARCPLPGPAPRPPPRLRAKEGEAGGPSPRQGFPATGRRECTHSKNELSCRQRLCTATSAGGWINKLVTFSFDRWTEVLSALPPTPRVAKPRVLRAGAARPTAAIPCPRLGRPSAGHAPKGT